MIKKLDLSSFTVYKEDLDLKGIVPSLEAVAVAALAEALGHLCILETGTGFVVIFLGFGAGFFFFGAGFGGVLFLVTAMNDPVQLHVHVVCKQLDLV